MTPDPLPSPLTAVIVDDESHARTLLRSMLEKCPHPVAVLAEADSMQRALEAVRMHRPQLLLLDVNLSPGSGFDVLEKLDAPTPEVIFVTAHDEYAIRAIRSSALDYLVKPVLQADLNQAIARCHAVVSEASVTRMEILRENLSQSGKGYSRLVLPTSKGFKVIQVSDILYCQADRTYTHFFLQDGRKLTSSRPLKVYEELLDMQGFFRCHQSWLIRLDSVVEYERRKKGGILLMADKAEIPLADSARREFQDLFGGI